MRQQAILTFCVAGSIASGLAARRWWNPFLTTSVVFVALSSLLLPPSLLGSHGFLRIVAGMLVIVLAALAVLLWSIRRGENSGQTLSPLSKALWVALIAIWLIALAAVALQPDV